MLILPQWETTSLHSTIAKKVVAESIEAPIVGNVINVPLNSMAPLQEVPAPIQEAEGVETSHVLAITDKLVEPPAL